MNRLSLHLKNCYGIRLLDHNFEFNAAESSGRAFAVYAGNGIMKSSLAKVFQDIKNGLDSKDEIFISRKPERKVLADGEKVAGESVFVMQPITDTAVREKTSSLLVNSGLKDEYDQIQREIDTSTSNLTKELIKQSSVKKGLESIVSGLFTGRSDGFERALHLIKESLEKEPSIPFADLKYDILFGEKALQFLESADMQVKLKEYIESYNKLLSASKFFSKGFHYYHGSTIGKSLDDNGFFDAQHCVVLNGPEKKEIRTRKDLEQIIEAEKQAILSDSQLQKKFKDIDDQIVKNQGLRQLHDYLMEKPEIIPELANLNEFRKKIWKSYFGANIELLNLVLETYATSAKRRQEIEAVAAQERTVWESVIEIFNSRFDVPFRLTARNKKTLVLGQDEQIVVDFEYSDGNDHRSVQKEELLRVLSTGEQRAFYILNLIFEIETRKKAGLKTLFIIDDVADSFDYKNKYAILQYLRDMTEVEHFRLIILTHNFDFFRTVKSRGISAAANCLVGYKTDTSLVLKKSEGVTNIFIENWKPNFEKDKKKMIGSIPFIRNIIEYTKGTNNDDYLTLTSLLHWKQNTSQITVSDLHKIFSEVFKDQVIGAGSDKSVYELVLETAKICLRAKDGINFENKIVLAIAIRLQAERYMVSLITDTAGVSSISENQTIKLLKLFKQEHSHKTKELETMEKVLLMTPENIHINSFMYEPILDMSDGHLRELFKEIQGLIPQEDEVS